MKCNVLRSAFVFGLNAILSQSVELVGTTVCENCNTRKLVSKETLPSPLSKNKSILRQLEKAVLHNPKQLEAAKTLPKTSKRSIGNAFEGLINRSQAQM